MEDRQYIAEFCGLDQTLGYHLVCSRFYFARARKEVVPNHKLGCWVMPSDPLRTSTYEARRASGQDHRGEDYQRWDCPFCGGETEPLPAPRIKRSKEDA